MFFFERHYFFARPHTMKVCRRACGSQCSHTGLAAVCLSGASRRLSFYFFFVHTFIDIGEPPMPVFPYVSYTSQQCITPQRTHDTSCVRYLLVWTCG